MAFTECTTEGPVNQWLSSSLHVSVHHFAPKLVFWSDYVIGDKKKKKKKEASNFPAL